MQENSAGCWVTRVFRSGNAAKLRRGDGVEVGDQLAAVNGESTYLKKVDQVYKLMSGSSNSREVELIFICYVEPIRAEKRM